MVNYSVSANMGTSSRTGTMTIAGLEFYRFAGGPALYRSPPMEPIV